MKRLSKWILAAVPLLLLLSLSVGAGTAGKTKPIKPRTLVTARGAIYAFAQDGDAIGWIRADARVRVRRLSTGRSWVVGRVPWPDRASSAVVALAGLRALWMWDDGGNSTAYPIVTGAPGRTPMEIVRLGRGLRGMGDGLDPTGLAGDGTTLVYGWVGESCPGWPLGGCENFAQPLVVTGGGVDAADAPLPVPPHVPPVIPNVPPPALFAASQGEVAVVAARSPTPVGQWVPRVKEDAPVEVYDLTGKLLLRAEMVGTVRDVALSGMTLAVLLELPNGRMRVDQFAIPNQSLVSAVPVPLGARDLAIGSGGTIFRLGRQIFVVRGKGTKLVARAAATPIGLTIEGRRIAWAENVKGHGRIVAVTLR